MKMQNLNSSQIKFLEQHNALDMEFDCVGHNLYTLEAIRDNNLLNDNRLIEKILQLPEDRQSEVLTQLLFKNGIDVELMSNKDLTPEQFTEHLNAAHYNYNIEYGHLKDSGRIPVSNELISDPTLTAKQLQFIYQAHTEQLIPEKLFKDNAALPEPEMYDALTEMRTNNLEYNIRLSEVNMNSKRLTGIENQNLLSLYIDGKENQQSANLFNKIITSNEFSSAENRSQYISDELNNATEESQLKTSEQRVNDNLALIESSGEKLENLSYLHDDPLVQTWLEEKPDLIRLNENAGLVRDYFFMEYGIESTKNDLAKLEQREDYLAGNRDAVDLYNFKTRHLNGVESRLNDFISSGKLETLNESLKINTDSLPDKKPLDYKSMNAPLDRHLLIEPENLLQLMGNANHYARELGLMPTPEILAPEPNKEQENNSPKATYILRGGIQPEIQKESADEPVVAKTIPQRESLEDLSKNFIPMSVDGKNYLENADKTVQIHDDHVAINDLSPETLQLAISATIAKFGNPLVIEGSKEFEESVLKILAENKQFSDIEVADPKHQAQLDKQKIEHNTVDKVTFTPEQIAENATYYFVDDHEDLSETGKKYSVEIKGGYLAFDTKDELISAIAHEKGITDVNLDLTDDLSELYNNGSIAEFEKEISEEYEFETTSTIEEIDHEKAIEQENE